jgi:hypothetical protein
LRFHFDFCSFFSRIRPGRRTDFIEERPRRPIHRHRRLQLDTPRLMAYNAPATTTQRRQLSLSKLLPRKVRRRDTELQDRVTIKARPITARLQLQSFSDQRTSPHTPRGSRREEGRIQPALRKATTLVHPHDVHCAPEALALGSSQHRAAHQPPSSPK